MNFSREQSLNEAFRLTKEMIAPYVLEAKLQTSLSLLFRFL